MKNLKVKKELIKFWKNYPVLIFYIIANFINSIVLRLFTTGHFGFRALFFDFAFVVTLAALSFFIKSKRKILYYILTTFFMVGVCFANSLYYNYYDSFASISMLAASVFVSEVADAVLEVVVRASDIIYFWVFIGLYIMYRKHKEEINNSKNYFKNLFAVSLVCIAIGCSLPPYTSYGRLFKLWNRISVVDTWGPYIYQIDDFVQSLKPRFNNIFGYDNALKETRDYYKNKKNNTKKNDYTGIFEGKNVIAIHAESLQTFAMESSFNGKPVTPNLRKIASEGLYFNNFYAQVGVGTSSDSEFTYATSLLPSNNGTVFVNYYNNKFITIQNLLKNKGYYVFSMHGNVGDFWNRESMHLNMGYDKFYSKSSFVIDEEYGLGLSDESFFRQAVPMIKEIDKTTDTPYYGTLITLTNHTPWGDTDKYANYDTSMTTTVNGETKTVPYLENVLMGKYIKSVNYMDKAIGEFIDAMDKEGLLENTVIVIYGDHDAKLGKKQFDYLYNYNPATGGIRDKNDPKYVEFNEYDYELSRKVPLIIWTKDMDNHKVVDTPMGMIDVMPTLGNMLNISNRYALGQDVMSIKKADGIVVFKDGSYVTDKVYYAAKNSEVYTLSNQVISDAYLQSKSKHADNLIEISNNIIVYDLMDKLEE